MAIQNTSKSSTVILVAIIVGIILLSLSLAIPYSTCTTSFCIYCRASRTENRTFFIRTGDTIKENAVSRYWRTNIDPKHRHDWKFTSRSFRMLGSGGIACGNRWSFRRMLNEQTELAILRSYKTPAGRKAFVQQFIEWGRRGSSDYMVTADKLEYAYEQNPARKDWQKILKQQGIIK